MVAGASWIRSPEFLLPFALHTGRVGLGDVTCGRRCGGAAVHCLSSVVNEWIQLAILEAKDHVTQRVMHPSVLNEDVI